MTVLIIVIGIVICVFSFCFFDYKQSELEYKKHESEYAEKTINERMKLDIEKERTEQYRLDRGKEEERTKQLQIKSDYRKNNDSCLY